jgi:hypothetical protein
MAADVSKATIMILLLLTIVVSVLSTIIVLDRAEQLKRTEQVSGSANEAKGYVSMSVARNAQPLPPDYASGTVGLSIIKNGKE